MSRNPVYETSSTEGHILRSIPKADNHFLCWRARATLWERVSHSMYANIRSRVNRCERFAMWNVFLTATNALNKTSLGQGLLQYLLCYMAG